MSLIVRCPCGFSAKVPERARGKRVRCKRCGQTLVAGFGPIDVEPGDASPGPAAPDEPSSAPLPRPRVHSDLNVIGGVLLVIVCAFGLVRFVVSSAASAPDRSAHAYSSPQPQTPDSDAYLAGQVAGVGWLAVLLVLGLRTIQYGRRPIHDPDERPVLYAPAALATGLTLLVGGGVTLLELQLGLRGHLGPDLVDKAEILLAVAAVAIVTGALLSLRAARHLREGRGVMR